MFNDGFLMKIINMLKKITTKLDLYKDDLTEITEDISIVNTSITNVQTATDEIKELVANEVAVAKNEIITELANTGNAHSYIVVPSDTVQYKTTIYLTKYSTTSSNYSLVGDYANIPFSGSVKIKRTDTRITGSDLNETRCSACATFYPEGCSMTSFSDTATSGWSYDSDLGYSRCADAEAISPVSYASRYVLGVYGRSYDADSVVRTTICVCYDIVEM